MYNVGHNTPDKSEGMRVVGDRSEGSVPGLFNIGGAMLVIFDNIAPGRNGFPNYSGSGSAQDAVGNCQGHGSTSPRRGNASGCKGIPL